MPQNLRNAHWPKAFTLLVSHSRLYQRDKRAFVRKCQPHTAVNNWTKPSTPSLKWVVIWDLFNYENQSTFKTETRAGHLDERSGHA
ncbi:Uncharacterised protein [Vibrio cholerae]|nr:Uncharacterised protein [Vibrio cholerae]